jgi:hypothetical protein
MNLPASRICPFIDIEQLTEFRARDALFSCGRWTFSGAFDRVRHLVMSTGPLGSMGEPRLFGSTGILTSSSLSGNGMNRGDCDHVSATICPR